MDENHRLIERADRAAGRDPTARSNRSRAGIRCRADRSRRVSTGAGSDARGRRCRRLVPGVPREGLLRADRIRIDRRAVKFLVDANVLSEPTKIAPNLNVVAWLRRNEAEIAVDPFILGEIRFGILLLPKGKRRARLERWFDQDIRRLHCLPCEAAFGARWLDMRA